MTKHRKKKWKAKASIPKEVEKAHLNSQVHYLVGDRRKLHTRCGHALLRVGEGFYKKDAWGCGSRPMKPLSLFSITRKPDEVTCKNCKQILIVNALTEALIANGLAEVKELKLK